MTKHSLTPNGITYALLDTNALIPPRLSDVLFDCAGHGMFLPRWTQEIEKEFIDNWGDVVLRVDSEARKGRKAAKLPPPNDHVGKARKRLAAFRDAVGKDDWEIIGYDDYEVVNRVPKKVDADDIHLAAACLVLLDALSEEPGNHRVFLLSNNLKDLAVSEMKVLGIEVLKPGKFIDLLCKAEPVRLEQSLRKTMSDLNNYSEEQLLSVLFAHGATTTAKHFCERWMI